MELRYCRRLVPVLLLIALSQLGTPATAEELAPDGWHVSFDYFGEVLAVVDGGLRTGAVYTGLAVVTVDFNGEYWSFHTNAYGPHGRSLTDDRYAGDFSVVSNIDTVHQARLQELWVERAMARGSLRVGLMAADTEFWGSEYGGLFVSSAFGAPTHVSGNLPGPAIFPVAALGARLAWGFGEGDTWRLAVLDGDAGDPAVDNPNGFDLTLDEGELILAEVQFDRVNGFERFDTLRFSGYWHTGDFVNEAGQGVPGNWGLLVGLDHAFSERLGWFGRLSVADSKRSLAPLAVETGINIVELWGGRGTFGAALAYVDLNDRIGALADPSVVLDHEAILELTYDWPLTANVSIQPDLQYIVDPGGSGAIEDALILGVRGKLSLGF